MYTTVVRIDICSVSAVSKYREFIHSILLYICECGSLYVVYYIFEFACVSSLVSEKRLSPLPESNHARRLVLHTLFEQLTRI